MENRADCEALIVDDNFFNRDLSALALRHIGFEITEAEDGLVALEILQNRSFDLLVLDLAMPKLDGISVLRRLRDQAIHKNMCIIVMTANPYMVTEDVDTVADYVMQKPIDVRRFAQLAKRLIERKTRSAPTV